MARIAYWFALFASAAMTAAAVLFGTNNLVWTAVLVAGLAGMLICAILAVVVKVRGLTVKGNRMSDSPPGSSMIRVGKDGSLEDSDVSDNVSDADHIVDNEGTIARTRFARNRQESRAQKSQDKKGRK